ncbi:hypothetical protein HOY80DRAFT_1090793, partial [Tuber brumale]
GSIRMAEDGTYMKITLPSSKTDPYRKGITLTIAASIDIGCPVHVMKRLQVMEYHPSPHSPPFSIGRHKQQAFTCEHVVKSLQALATLAGLGQGTWNGHSFRRGAATWVAEMGIEEGDIQIFGCGILDAYKAYIE